MTDRCNAFTLVEILIGVVILGILAMVVVPKFSAATQEARESALASDLAVARRQITLYKAEHKGRSPHLNASGTMDTANFIARMTSKTNISGQIASGGTYGPYMHDWPGNPLCSEATAKLIQFNSSPISPRNGETGWYFSLSTEILYSNTPLGGVLVQIEGTVSSPSPSPPSQ